MNENALKFKEFAEKNPEVMEKLKAAKSSDEIIAVAAENGFTLEAADLALNKDGEVGLDELDSVAGGLDCSGDAECWCIGFIVVAEW